MQVSMHNLGEAYTSLLAAILSCGEERTTRGLKHRELLGVQVIVPNWQDSIIVHPVRDLNYRFMIAEWLWIFAGAAEVALIAPYNKHYKNYSDDGLSLAGAYGPRLNPQWPYILDALRAPDTRQAVATIWTPSPVPSRDIPCTISIQWLPRDGRLNAIVTMRSSDAWLGLPYDVFTFCQLTNWLAGWMKLEPGYLIMQLGSSHLYEEHWDKAKHLLEVDSRSNGGRIAGPGICEVRTLRSPRLTAYTPNVRTLEDHLRQDPARTILAEYPWNHYAGCLAMKKRSEALARLEELHACTTR